MPTRAAAWMLLWLASALLLGTSLAQVPTPVTLAVPGRTNTAPWIAAHDRFVAVSWGAQGDGGSDIYVATSDDGGRTFGRPVRVNAVAGEGRVNGEIPPRVALHLPPGASRPEVLAAWNAKDQGTEIKVARSRDFGRTFGAAVALQASGVPGDRGWHALALDDQGVAHVLWLDHRGLAEARGEHQHKGEHDGVAMAQRSGLRYATYGAGPSAERELTPGVCYCCKTAMVALPGGRVVSAWRHVYPGNLRDIAFTESRDRGATFAPIARVSEDGWAINGCPDDGPALAAGAGGRVHIVWPTVIPGDEPLGALFHAHRDGKGVFSARSRVPTLGSPKPSHPQVVVDGSGRVFIAWDEFVNGVRTAAAVDAAVRDGRLQFSAPSPLATDGPTSYPVMAPLDRGVLVAYTAGHPTASVITVRRLMAAPAASPAAR